MNGDNEVVPAEQGENLEASEIVRWDEAFWFGVFMRVAMATPAIIQAALGETPQQALLTALFAAVAIVGLTFIQGFDLPTLAFSSVVVVVMCLFLLPTISDARSSNLIKQAEKPVILAVRDASSRR